MNLIKFISLVKVLKEEEKPDEIEYLAGNSFFCKLFKLFIVFKKRVFNESFYLIYTASKLDSLFTAA